MGFSDLSPISHPILGRILQMLRENLEEEAIIMKDVPDWKVGAMQRGGQRSRSLEVQHPTENVGPGQVAGAV